MKFIILLAAFFALPVLAAEPQSPTPPQPPTVGQPKPPTSAPAVTVPAPANHAAIRPGKLTEAQQLRVTQRLPQVKKVIADLSTDEQRAVLRKAAPPRVKLTDTERATRAKAARDAWAAKTPAMRAELRHKQLAAWQKLAPEDRAYRTERMREQLQALPESDRKTVIAPWVPSNVGNAPQ